MKFKTALIAITLMVLLTGTVFAAKPVIKADTTYFDVNTGLYVLKGNVYIETGKRIITASQARVSMGALEVWGSGGITVTEGDIYFTGESVYVYGKQSLAKIDGGVQFSRTGLDIAADQAEFNWRTKIAVFSGNVKVAQDGNIQTVDTLSYNVKTNCIQ